MTAPVGQHVWGEARAARIRSESLPEAARRREGPVGTGGHGSGGLGGQKGGLSECAP
jgi:hypothetical protein